MDQREKQLRDKRRRRAKALKNPTPVELPSGVYRCQVTVNGERLGVTDPDPDVAHAKALALKAKLVQQQKNLPRLTLRKAIDDYIASKGESLSPSTRYGYRSIQRTRFQTAMDLDLNQITDDQWQEFCNREECSPKTLKNAWMFITSVIYRATKRRVQVSLPAIPRNERPYLSHDQILVFVQAVAGERCEIPALLALCSLRRSEILGLHWRDIDLERRLVNVHGASVMGEDSKMVYKDTNKNATSQRLVPILIPQLEDAVRERAGDPEDTVVTGNANQLWAQINAVCDQTGLPRVGVHGLRHSFASLAYYLGIPEKVAMEIGGWKNSKTMHDIYTHIAQQDIADRAKEIRAFYSGEKSDDLLAQKEAEIVALKAQLAELQERLSILDNIQKQFSILLGKGA